LGSDTILFRLLRELIVDDVPAAAESQVVDLDSDKLLLTAREAADILGVSRSKMYELLACGLVESVKIGSMRRVPRAALDDFVGQLRRRAARQLGARRPGT
jgi:excisionase family DNA binding protein